MTADRRAGVTTLTPPTDPTVAALLAANPLWEAFELERELPFLQSPAGPAAAAAGITVPADRQPAARERPRSRRTPRTAGLPRRG